MFYYLLRSKTKQLFELANKIELTESVRIIRWLLAGFCLVLYYNIGIPFSCVHTITSILKPVLEKFQKLALYIRQRIPSLN